MRNAEKSILAGVWTRWMKRDVYKILFTFFLALLLTAGGLFLVCRDYRRTQEIGDARAALLLEDERARQLNEMAINLLDELNSLKLLNLESLPLLIRGPDGVASAQRRRETWTGIITNALSNILVKGGRIGRARFPNVKAVFVWSPQRNACVWDRPAGSVLRCGLPEKKAMFDQHRYGHWMLDAEKLNGEAVVWADVRHEKLSQGNCYCGLLVDWQQDVYAFPASSPPAYRFIGVVMCVAIIGVLLFAWPFSLVLHSRSAREEAERKTMFVSNVSHELKTPLTSILGYAEMLESGLCRNEEKRRRALKVIGEEGRRLNRMVTELLEFSRLERGTSQYHPTEFDASMVVEETVERLSPDFSEHGLHVHTCERVWIVADCDKVKEILENLLTNARKYAAADGPVEVSLERMPDCVRIHVCDRGPGMTENQRRHAFEPFWRADDAITKKTGGYGIGLPLARGYARGMGGDLTVTARAGGGCDFVLELPLKHETKEHENG